MDSLQAIGIVVEYNPFHNGHAWQIAEIKKKFPTLPIIAVMSGNFVQRGEPAFCDKWTRAKMAVIGGVDLVIELPTIYSLSSAEMFARGAVDLFTKCNLSMGLAFGAECAELEKLLAIAKLLEDDNFDAQQKKMMDQGLSFAKAREVVSAQYGYDNIIRQPNNILAIEYLRSINLLQSKLQPILIPRTGSQHNEKNIVGGIASATAIRAELKKNGLSETIERVVSSYTYKQLVQKFSLDDSLYTDKKLFFLLSYTLRLLSLADIKKYALISEGLEYKIKTVSKTAQSYEELLAGIVSKRYPLSRVRRILLQILLQVDYKELINCPVEYLRVLAFNDQGRFILNKLKIHSSMQIITKLGKDRAGLSNDKLLALDIRATNIYQMLVTKDTVGECNLDYLISPHYEKENKKMLKSPYQNIDTPALLVDEKIMRENLAFMQSKANKFGVKLRPHTKTHRMPELALLQVASGASGITVAKTAEAVTMAKYGLQDIFIANEIVGVEKLREILVLHKKIKICIGVDNEFQINQIEEVFATAEQPLEVLIEVEVGENRSGVISKEQLIKLAECIKTKKHMRLKGVFSHEGHSYKAKDAAECIELSRVSQERTLEFANILKEMGFPIDTVSIGATPSMMHSESIIEGITEIRPGTYIFMDVGQASAINDFSKCAATVLATVISKPNEERVVLDTGAKALTSQNRSGGICATPGFGVVKNSNNLRLSGVFDEHGLIYDAEFSKKIAVGDKIEIIPNHICPTCNLYEKVYLVSAGKVIKEIPVLCRGNSQ